VTSAHTIDSVRDSVAAAAAAAADGGGGGGRICCTKQLINPR